MVNKPSSAANEPIPKRLRQLRQALNYEFAKDFADKLGVSHNRYGNIEAGSNLSIEIAQLIVQKFPGMSLDWLYNGRPNGLSAEMRQALAPPGTTKAKTTPPPGSRGSGKRG
jgi:transcriptional regulator with XRE-family HTH domain